MPVAQHFMSRGVGNGFPFCCEPFDVTAFDLWTTLSGVNASNFAGFTPEELEVKINESLALAMKFYWNGFSLDAYSEATAFRSGSWNTSVIIDGIDVSGSFAAEPKSRSCGGVALKITNEIDLPSSAQMVIWFARPFRIIHDGTFYGYGFGDNFDGDALAFVRATPTGGSQADIEITGVIESAFTSSTFDQAYVTLGGASFLCEATISPGSGATSTNVNAANLTASFTTSFMGDTTAAEVSIATTDAIGFYTYSP